MKKETDEKIKIAKFQESLPYIMDLYNMSGKELGRRLGISNVQVSHIRRGHSKIDKATYIAILVALTDNEDYIEQDFLDTTKKKTKQEIEKLNSLCNQEES